MRTASFIFLLTVSLNVVAEDADIRVLAPPKPQSSKSQIALPQSGTSLNEIGGDWARRQIHLSTNGADEQFLLDTNETLDRMFGFAEESVQNDRSPASAKPEPRSWLKPRSLHMSKLGEFELAFGSSTKLHCDLVNGNELTLSKPIFQDIDLRLHHANTLNSVQLKFNW